MTSSPTTASSRGSRVRRLALLGGPSTRPISGRRWFPLYGVLHHVGRKSGREYATPVVIRAGDDAIYVPLPFGPGTDWYRNALAAGGVRATWKGRDLWLGQPRVVGRRASGDGFNRVMRWLMDRADIDVLVRFETSDE